MDARAEAVAETAAAAEPARRDDGPAPALSFDTAGVLALQRRAGNAAVVRTLARRVPSPGEVQGLYAGGLLSQADVEDAMRRALRRMDADIGLRTSADDVMAKLFPGGGVFDASKWSGVLGTDKGDVYQRAADAEAKIRPADLAKLTAAAAKAAAEIDKAMADDAGLKDVFGSQAAVAKTRYAAAKAALGKAIAKADAHFDVDYNGDDDQTGLGGLAGFDSQHIHLEGDVAEVLDEKATIITLIHEAAHLSDPSVDDRGYYGSGGFEAMEEAEKVANAAHYEELPARSLGVSRYRNRDPKDPTKLLPGFQTFTPKQTAGGAVTFEQEVLRQASEYLRKAWDAAVDMHAFVRDTNRRINTGPATGATFAARKAFLLEVSKVAQLTIHKQRPKPSTVTLLDLVLSEGVAHATTRIQAKLRRQAIGSGSKASEVRKAIEGAVSDYGELTGDHGADMRLMDWLVAHYRKIG